MPKTLWNKSKIIFFVQHVAFLVRILVRKCKKRKKCKKALVFIVKIFTVIVFEDYFFKNLQRERFWRFLCKVLMKKKNKTVLFFILWSLWKRRTKRFCSSFYGACEKEEQNGFVLHFMEVRQTLIFTVANFWPHVGKKCFWPNPYF